MREQLKTLSQETLVYGLSTVVGRFLNFLLVPFYVNVLRSTAEYGIATSLYTYIAFMNVIYPMGLEAAFFRYGSRAEGETFNAEREKTMFSTPFLFIFFMATIFTGILLIAAPHLAWPIFHDPKVDITPMLPDLIQILKVGAWILFIDSLAILPFAVLRLEHQAKKFAFIRLSGIVLTLALNFILVMRFRQGVKGIFIANLAGSILMIIFLAPVIKERLTLRLEGVVLKKLLPFGLTNVPASLGAMMVQVIDRPLVQSILGLGALGVYQANYRMGFVMMVFVGLFEYAWRPFFMRQSLKDDQQARRLFSRVFTYFITLALVAFLALSWSLPHILTMPIMGHRLLREPYFAGLPIIPVILLAYVFQGAYTNFIAGIYIKERNRVLPLVTGLGAVVNIVVNLLLIPKMGMMGAALATLLAYAVMAGALYFFSQRVYPIQYEWSRVGLVCGIVFVAYGISWFFGNPVSLQLILFACAIAAVGSLFAKASDSSK